MVQSLSLFRSPSPSLLCLSVLYFLFLFSSFMQFFLFFMKAENRGGKSGKKLERKRRGERRGGISTNWIYQKKGYFQSSNSSMPTKSPGFWLFPLHLASPKMCHCTCCTSFTLFPHPEAMGAVFFPPKSALLCTHCTL